MTSDTREMLEDFRKRMKFINTVKHFTERKMPDNIRGIFENNTDLIDNVIVMTLLYVMDHTLRYDERCGMSDITAFIREISEIYPFDSDNAEIIAEYIVVDVFQNGGKVKNFDTYNEKENVFYSAASRVVSEEGRSYKLTDDVYDFLFRTKEIDSEIDFSVNRFRLNEFIRRGNYSKALKESRELVTRIRGLKTRMDDFILRCRTDISAVAVDEYEEILKQVRDVFEDEQKQLNDIRKVVSSKLDILVDEIQNGSAVKNAEQTEKEIKEILKNISIVIEEQGKVYNKKFSLSECYGELLDEEFSYFSTGRFDFEKTILMPVQQMTAEDAVRLSGLFIPLYKPRFNKLFSIENLYAKQKNLREKEDADIIDVSGAEDIDGDIFEERNRRFSSVVKSLFEFIHKKEKVAFSEYILSLSSEDKQYFAEENTLFNVILKLYGMENVNIREWRESNESIVAPAGEFNLSYCLSELSDNLTEMDEIRINKSDNTFEMMIENGLKITTNDFVIEVS